MPMSRAEMEQFIKEGGSVLYGGQIITRVEHLPSEAELAKGDPAKEQAAADDLRAELARIQAQLDTLTAAQQGQQEQPSGQQQGQQASTPLSDDFPFARELRAGGYTTREQVEQASDEQLDAVSGIGQASIKQIRAALEA